MHKIRALCILIRTETLQNATAGRGRRRLQNDINIIDFDTFAHLFLGTEEANIANAADS